MELTHGAVAINKNAVSQSTGMIQEGLNLLLALLHLESHVSLLQQIYNIKILLMCAEAELQPVGITD